MATAWLLSQLQLHGRRTQKHLTLPATFTTKKAKIFWSATHRAVVSRQAVCSSCGGDGGDSGGGPRCCLLRVLPWAVAHLCGAG